MSSQPTATHQIEVYTSNAAWRGDLTLPSHRRVLDFMNDALQNFFTLTNITQLGWEYGIVASKGSFASMRVHRNTVITVVRNVDPMPVTDTPSRIEKVLHRLAVYAPPFTLEGSYQMIKGGDLFETLDSSRQDFFALMNGMMLLDHTPLLLAPAEFLGVNRRYMTGFRILE